MDYGMRLLPALLLLIVANATPVVARRVRLAAGTEIPGLDQLPGALLAALLSEARAAFLGVTP